jgi:hypothetical protein
VLVLKLIQYKVRVGSEYLFRMRKEEKTKLFIVPTDALNDIKSQIIK